MTKEVTLVFQDCPYCAPREEWGKEQTRIAKENGIKVNPAHFSAPGVKGLILKAQSRGVSALPFFTDGEKFSYNLRDFVTSRAKDVDTEVVVAKHSRSKGAAKTIKESNGEEIAPEA